MRCGCLNAFLKVGGKVFLSGRRRESIESFFNHKKNSSLERLIYFCDDDGLTSVMRKGSWFFQKFLYKHQVDAMIQKVNFYHS